MFQIKECDPNNGRIVVADDEFGLWFEFHEPDLVTAKIVDDYDLHIETKDGTNKVLSILER